MNIYLAGAIDLVNAEHQNWKELFSKELSHISPPDNHVWTAFNPSAPYILFGQTSHTLHRGLFIKSINNAALDLSDIVVAYVAGNKASVGTPIEIEQAYRLRKSIFILTDIPWGVSIYLMQPAEKRENYIDKRPSEDTDTFVKRAVQYIGTQVKLDIKEE